MCGIFGIVGDELSPRLIDQVRHLLRHRGPDDYGLYRADGITFVHCRLSIIDLTSGGHQPMRSPDGGINVTYNGEIYNYRELRRELEPHYVFRTNSDTEVILAAYSRWGDECLNRLRGMFAFGLWDERRQRLVCATDRLSIKPLLYSDDDGRFLFASEVKPLAAAGVVLRPNRRRLYDYLHSGLLDHTDQTLFEGVNQLRPGTYLVFERYGRTCNVQTYWDLRDEGDVEWKGESTIDSIDETLQEAVDLHLRGDVEPSLSLSSGLDSTLLRGIIQRDGRNRGLRCFTYCFEGTKYDECSRVEPLVRDTDIRHQITNVTSDQLIDRLKDLIHVMEGPAGGLGTFGYWLNSEQVSNRGIKVLLDGQGADEAFAGYKYYYGVRLAELERNGDRTKLLNELSSFNWVHETNVRYPSCEFDELVAREGESVQMRAPDGTLLSSDYLAKEFSIEAAYAPDPLPRPFRDPVKNSMYRDLMFLKIPKLLRFQDRCAMTWSVEVRVPYLDHVLLERLYRIPSNVLLSGGITKALLRQIGPRYLRESVATPKLYVSTPQREWFKTSLRADIEELIAGATLAADGFVDPEAIRRQYAAYCASPELGNSFFIWKFVNLELWYRLFIVGNSGVDTTVAN